MSKNINENNFDLDSLSDLPPSIVKLVITRKPKNRNIYDKILELMSVKKSLSLNEIIVGLYRLFKIEFTDRPKINTILHTMKLNGEISYERIDKVSHWSKEIKKGIIK